MQDFTPWMRQCSHEAVRMSLHAVKEWLPQASKIRKPGGGEEEFLTDELRLDLNQKIDSALEMLSKMSPDTFNVEEMFADHSEILFNCLEFYGEYIHNMLTFIGKMYRLTFKNKIGVFPEELAAQMAAEQSAANNDPSTSQT